MAAVRARPLLEGLSHEVLVDHGVVGRCSRRCGKARINLIVIGITAARRRKDAAGIDCRGNPAVRARSAVDGWPENSIAQKERLNRSAFFTRRIFPGVRACDALRVTLAKEYEATLFSCTSLRMSGKSDHTGCRLRFFQPTLGRKTGIEEGVTPSSR